MTPGLVAASYAFYAHILTWYHANPYLAVPRDFPFDPLFNAIFWKDQSSNYGPVWTYLSALVTLHALDTRPSHLLEATVLVVASAAATMSRYVALRWWVFAERRKKASASPMRDVDYEAV